jgi:peptidoglycan/LPS O-acetylase OafA/YrhL
MDCARSSLSSQAASIAPTHPDERCNNIGAIRLILAIAVIYSHSFPLSLGKAFHDPLAAATRDQLNGGQLAVGLFFLLSGYLITKSWYASDSAAAFIRKRILRIYPGYLVALGISAMVGIVGAYPDSLHYLRQIYHHNERLLQAALTLQYGVLDGKGAFPSNPYPDKINGSLWTLQPELLCYLCVVVAGAVGFLNRRHWIVGACIVAHLGYAVNHIHLHGPDENVWRLFSFFGHGALFFIYRDRIPLRSPAGLGIALAVLVIAAIVKPLLCLILPFAGGYWLFSLAFARHAPLHRVFDRWDLSYGIYIYAFPVQQLCVWILGIRDPLLLFAASTPITAVMAWLSWTVVERPSLRRKSRRPADPPAEPRRKRDVGTPLVPKRLQLGHCQPASGFPNVRTSIESNLENAQFPP